MAAGLGFIEFTTGDVLSAAAANGYLASQTVMVFADAAARTSAITSPQEGMFSFLKDTNATQFYDGAAWVNLDTTGMVNPMTTTGDVIYSSSGTTPARLGIGTAGQVLTVNTGATAPEWAAPAGGGGYVVVKDETAFSAVANITADGIFTSAYTNYRIIFRYATSAAGDINMQFRAATVDTTTNYNFQQITASSTTVSAARTASASAGMIGRNTDGNANISLIVVDLNGVELAAPTNYQAFNSRNDAALTTPIIAQFFGNQSASTAFDGIKIAISVGNMTGSYTIYGYGKTV
jgi:hypothetical protein